MSAIAWAYIAGAAIELVGLGTVAWDVRASARTLRAMSDPHWRGEQTGSLFRLIAEVAAGNILRRRAGVALIAGGLIVQTVASVAAL